MTIEFSGEIWYWRGPAPFYFVTVPERESASIKEIVSLVTYGWGMVPVIARVGNTEFKTALWPKDGRYVLPLKDAVRKAEGLEEGDTITAKMEISQFD
ncbi:MAG: hypothetical protein HONBIEJF_00958 [Fimbriimonadaceae bacterium]|nr:hypothetical protein [Fimbriimonadaceae bacterium]